MIYIIPVIYFILIIVHAWYHSYLADEKNKTIQSKQKIFEWGLASFICFWSLLTWSDPLPLIIFPIVTRLAHFDIAFNFWRGDSWLYEGEINKKKSIWDYIENKIGLPTWFYRVFYMVIYFVYLITYLIQYT